MKIGICDDEILIVNMLERMVEGCLKKKNIDFEIHTFDSGEKLLKDGAEMDAVFLDIEMPFLDGIEAGKQFQKTNPHCKIIMATCKTERFKESFKIHAIRFVTKPFEIEEIEEALDVALQSRIGMETIELYESRNKYDIVQRNIKYIWAYDSYAEFAVGNKVMRKEVSLTALEGYLDSSLFFRVNRKYIVNLFWIRRYKNGIIFIDDKEIRVARNKKKEFEKTNVMFDLTFR